MTREARLMSGIILITVPTIQYGGYFLLTSLMNNGSGYMGNPLRQNFFRAGHAHAGVIVILSLICQILADGAVLPDILLWAVRIGVPIGVQFAEFQPKFFGLGLHTISKLASGPAGPGADVRRLHSHSCLAVRYRGLPLQV